MIRTRGSIPYPAAETEQVMMLATNLIRVARLLEGNAQAHRRAAQAGTSRWTGQAADAFAAAAERRAEHALRAAASLTAVGEALARHGSVIHNTSYAYEASAQAEQHLRRYSPTAVQAIEATMHQQVNSVVALNGSSSSITPVIRESINEFFQMTSRANVDASRPEVIRATADDNRFGWDDVAVGVGGGAAERPLTLDRIERGTLLPDPGSRLGAYAGTVGYPPGSVGHAVHRAIGSIYLTMGTVGEERIGTVFNSPEAIALFDKPLTRETSRQMAEMEYAYWRRRRDENGWSVGGQLGSAFNPTVRDFLQRDVFGAEGDSVPPPQPPRAPRTERPISPVQTRPIRPRAR
jgi:hypothetical protein